MIKTKKSLLSRIVGKTGILALTSLPLVLLSAGTAKQELRGDGLMLKRINLSGQIAKIKLDIERLTDKLAENEASLLPMDPEEYKARMLEFETAKERLILALKRYLEKVRSQVDEWGLEDLQNRINEAKNDVFFSTVLEISLYIFGFKWLWGLFTGYATTFLGESRERIDKIFSTVGGRGVNSPRVGFSSLNSELAEAKREIDRSLLGLEKALTGFELSLLGSGLEDSFKEATEKIKDFGGGIAEFILTNEEEILSEIDSKRGLLENYLIFLKLGVEQQLLAVINTAKRKQVTLGYRREIEDLTGLIQEQVKDFKQEEVYRNIARMTFREAAAPPVSLINIANGFQGSNSFQTENLSSFRNWRLAALARADIIRREREKVESKISLSLVRLRNISEQIAKSGVDNKLALSLNLLTNMLSETTKGIRELLDRLWEDASLETYNLIFKRLEKILEDRLNGVSRFVEINFKDEFAKIKITTTLKEQIERLRLLLKQKEEELRVIQVTSGRG